MTSGALLFGALSAQAAQRFDDRPFFGTTEGTSEATVTGPGSVATVGAGTINATHVGDGEYTIEANQDYPRHMESNTDHPTGQCAFIEDGEDGDGTPGFVITAADGDQIFAYIDDDRSVTCAPDDQPPTGPSEGDVYESTLYMTVVGGTGRFEDASGWLFSRSESTVTAVRGLPTPGSDADDTSTILGDIDY
jgi:hypothetical protein